MLSYFFHKWKYCVLVFFYLLVCGNSYAKIPRSLPSDPMIQQQLLRTCSFTGSVANFCNANVTGQLCVNGTPIIGGYGNTLIVDQVDGDDDIGAANGPRFQTIGVALSQADDGDLVLVYPGVYNEVLVVPEGVTLAGVSINTVTIQQLNVTEPTDLITLGEGGSLLFLDLKVTAAADVQIRGITHVSPGGPDLETTTITYVRIILDNTEAGPTTSDIIGVNYTGLSVPTINDLFGVVIINVTSNSSGRSRGVLAESDQYIVMTTSSIQVDGGTDSIGIETNSMSGITIISCFSSQVSGSTADISQTSGTLGLGSTYLFNSTANGLGFDSLDYPSFFIWADSDNPVGPGDTLYLRPGTGFASFIPILISALQKFVALSMTVRVVDPPGLGQSTTFTLQRKRPTDLVPLDTILSITLSDLETFAIMDTVSVHFDQGDDICMQISSTAGAQTGDVIVSVGIY